jgi:DeoR family glycerol-3-phosphate regulon repressor
MLYYASYCSILQDFITMHKTARQKYLVDLISENGQVSISDLVEKLQVSADTLRRDLADLEKQGLAQKNHGGAIALDISAMNRQGRNALLPQTKQRLGRLVASKIPAGSTLFLDAGSTVLAVATQIQGPMTVITTSLDIASHFSTRPDIQLIMLGEHGMCSSGCLPAAPPWHCWRAIVPISLSSAPAPSMRNSV